MATQANISGAKSRIAVTTVALDPMTTRALAHCMSAVAGAVIVSNLDSYAGAEWEIGRAGEQARTRICFVDYDKNPEQATRLTERLRTDYGDVYIFAVSGSSDSDQIIAAMRAGCAEYLQKPIQNDRVLDGLSRVEAKQKERARSRVRGTIIGLIGAKGGTGVTSLALHLALQLTGTQKKCLLVDQHSALGDVSLYLGTGRHPYSFYELAGNTDRLDEELLSGFLLHHPSGLDVLDSPEAVDAIHGAPPSAIEHTIAFLADLYRFVVVDCPPGLTEASLACMAQADQIAIVLTAELPAVRNTVRYIDHLAKMGVTSDKICIVLNRYSKRGPLTDDRIEKAIGRQISIRIPNSYNEVIRAINAGTPVEAGKSDFGAAVAAWARDLAKNTDKVKSMSAGQGSRGGMLSIFK